ncbi:hypothetical protein EAA2563_03420 [Enterobacter asburiae]|nr:hypothetical protein EAA2563_03420 [Enterobacter asburiae]
MTQKGGFTGTGWPQQRHHFALLDGQINGMQSLIVMEGLAQFLDADDGLHVLGLTLNVASCWRINVTFGLSLGCGSLKS